MSDADIMTQPPPRSGEELLRALAERPGGPELLQLATDEPEAMLVGGAVRDLLLGGSPRELDVTVAVDAAGFAERLAALLAEVDPLPFPPGLAPPPPPPGGPVSDSGPAPLRVVPPRVTRHERFGTASIDWVMGRVDVATRRAESYAKPGALPDVRAGTVEEDLARRDFTVNAISLRLGGPQAGKLLAVERAFEDLAARRLRVMHEASFTDDPTRILRLARYSARLGFEAEAHTRALAGRSLTGGALRTVSGRRISSELGIAALNCEAKTFAAFGELGVLAALGLPARFDRELWEAAESLISAPDCHCEDVLMAVAFHPPDDDGPAARERAAALLERLEHPAPGREQILACSFGVSAIAAELRPDTPPSRLRELLSHLQPAGVAVVAALAERTAPGAGASAARWLEDLRHVSLQITGEDLVRAGIPAGPAVGRALDATLAQLLDGTVPPDRQAQLQAALAAARESP